MNLIIVSRSGLALLIVGNIEIEVWFCLTIWTESENLTFHSSSYDSCFVKHRLLFSHLLLVPCKKVHWAFLTHSKCSHFCVHWLTDRLLYPLLHMCVHGIITNVCHSMCVKYQLYWWENWDCSAATKWMEWWMQPCHLQMLHKLRRMGLFSSGY